MSTDHDPVYLHAMRVENFLRIELVQVGFNGPRLEIISGNNAQGKSSVLKAIIAALGGAKFLPEQPVRNGADHAEIDLDLGDMLVHLRVKPEGKATLSVTAKDGSATFKSPQKLLDSLVGQFAFDPLKLLHLKPAERLAAVRRLVGIDTSERDEQQKALYEKRTGIGRDHKLLQGQLSGLVVPPDPGPAPEPLPVPLIVSIAALAAEHQQAVEQKRQNDLLRLDLANAEGGVEALTEKVETLRNALLGAEAALARAQERQGAVAAAVAALVDPDLAASAQALQDAEVRNYEATQQGKAEGARQQAHRDLVAARERALAARQAKAAEVQAKGQEYDLLTAAIDGIEAAKTALLAEAKFPVPGMGFGADDITFNGIPWAQCSASEQLRVCLATGAAQNPRMRLIMSEAGNDLDLPRLREMDAWAREHDMQLLLERVAGETPVGLVIDCGKVAGDYREGGQFIDAQTGKILVTKGVA